MNDQEDKKRSIIFKFTLNGDPTVVHSNKQNVAKYWYAHKQVNMDREFQLEEQLKNHKRFHGNVSVFVECFFTKPYLKGKKHDIFSSYIVSDLTRFIERLCEGTIYDKSAIVTSFNLTKSYDSCPRTIVTIVEMK